MCFFQKHISVIINRANGDSMLRGSGGKIGGDRNDSERAEKERARNMFCMELRLYVF
jgi:hypothetical protein